MYIYQQSITRTILQGIVLMTILGLFLPLVTFGKEIPKRDGQFQGDFCASIQDIRDRLEERHEFRIDRISKKEDHQGVRLEDQFTKKDMVRADHRRSKDRSFEARIAELRKRYPDTDDQMAIDDFEDALRKARDDRRTALDASVQEFRSEIENLTEDRFVHWNAQVEAERLKILQALEDAEESCNNGVSSSEVRKSFLNQVQESRKEMQKLRPEWGQVSQEIRERISRKKDEAKDIGAIFKEAISHAHEVLRQALGE